MITAWARAGRDFGDVMSSSSVAGCYLVEQPLIAGTAELGDGRLVALHRPVPEVEFECAGTMLDAAPQCPAVFGHDALQVGPRRPVRPRTAVVSGDELVELVEGEPALAPDV